MDRDDDGETSYKYNTFVDDVAFEPTSLQALPTAAGRNVATLLWNYRMSQKIPLGFSDIFPNGCKFSVQILHAYYTCLSTLDNNFFCSIISRIFGAFVTFYDFFAPHINVLNYLLTYLLTPTVTK